MAGTISVDFHLGTGSLSTAVSGPARQVPDIGVEHLRAANAKRCFGPPSVETKDRAANFGVLYLTTKLSVVGPSWSLRRYPAHVLWLTPLKTRKNAC